MPEVRLGRLPAVLVPYLIQKLTEFYLAAFRARFPAAPVDRMDDVSAFRRPSGGL